MNISDELTIVIPAKNEERLLPRLLMSLEEQDYPLMANTRVILADADSTDRTIPLAMKFTNSLTLTVIHGGLPSVGRNRGAICADSRYILFLDADIELPDPTLIRRAVERMKQKSLHCVTTDILLQRRHLARSPSVCMQQPGAAPVALSQAFCDRNVHASR